MQPVTSIPISTVEKAKATFRGPTVTVLPPHNFYINIKVPAITLHALMLVQPLTMLVLYVCAKIV